MADLLIRNISKSTISRLKSRAQANNRSLQAELKVIVEQAAASLSKSECKQLAASIRLALSDRTHTDSTFLVSEDRAR